MERIENINRINSIDNAVDIKKYNFELDFKNIEQEVANELKVRVSLPEIKMESKIENKNIEMANIEISQISREIATEIEKLENNFKEIIFNSLNISNKVENNNEILKNTKDIFKEFDRIKLLFSNLDIDKNRNEIKIVLNKLYDLGNKFVDILNKEIEKNEKLLYISKDGFDKELKKESNIVEEKLEYSYDYDIKKTNKNVEKGIENVREKFNKNIKLNIEEYEKILSEIIKEIENIDIEPDTQKSKNNIQNKIDNIIKNLVKIIDNNTRENVKLIALFEENEVEENRIKNDKFFNKFRISGELDLYKNLLLIVAEERKKELKKIEKDNIYNIREYREGRKDFGYVVDNINKIEKNNYDIKILFTIILILVFVIWIVRKII